MKAYALDLREKVLRAVDQGFPRGEIVKLLGVSRATIKRYLRTATRDGRGGSQSHSRPTAQETGCPASRADRTVASP